jgi:hypothetical protein
VGRNFFHKERKGTKKKRKTRQGEAYGNCRNYGNPLEKRADFHSCLDKTERKTCSVLSTVPTGPAINKQKPNGKKTIRNGAFRYMGGLWKLWKSAKNARIPTSFHKPGQTLAAS